MAFSLQHEPRRQSKNEGLTVDGVTPAQLPRRPPAQPNPMGQPKTWQPDRDENKKDRGSAALAARWLVLFNMHFIYLITFI